ARHTPPPVAVLSHAIGFVFHGFAVHDENGMRSHPFPNVAMHRSGTRVPAAPELRRRAAALGAASIFPAVRTGSRRKLNFKLNRWFGFRCETTLSLYCIICRIFTNGISFSAHAPRVT